MRRARYGICLALLAWLAFTGRPSAQAPPPQAVFHGGMSGGIVRDVTKVGSVLYAVGSWLNPATSRTDSVLWTIDGTNAPVLTPLPNVTTGGANLAGAEAITPDAAYIASQARSGNGPSAVRVSRGATLTNLELTPAPTFTSANNPKRALGLSDNGAIVYGTVNTLAVAGSNRVVRFAISGGVSTMTTLFPVPNLDTGGFQVSQSMPARGVSSDGSVAVGVTFTSRPFIDTHGWRYVNTGGTPTLTFLPFLDGGSWNQPLALSNDGVLTLMIANSDVYPNGEVAIHNASTGAVTPLGMPNTAWGGIGVGGISDDGAVVAFGQQGTCTQPCTPDRNSYIHNARGWFSLSRVLTDAGVDLTGWRGFRIFGMSGDATRIWGSAEHDGNQEGFVVEIAADYLRNYTLTAAPPADTSIVGAWAIGDAPLDPAQPQGVVAFLADGTYFDIEPDGFERGFYWFDGGVIRVATLVDTNGSSGLSDDNGGTRTLSITGDELRVPANCVPGGPVDCGFATRIQNVPGTLTGGWVAGDPTQPDSSSVIVFTSGGRFFMAQDGPREIGSHDGFEIGSVTWTLQNGTFSAQSVTLDIDTNGEWGLSNPIGTIIGTPSPNELTALAGDDSGTQPISRIIDPTTVAQVTGGSADGVVGAPFSYQVTAQRAQGVAATGLPDGLTIDGSGLIAGTPTVTGFFPVTVSATNAFGDPKAATVNITIASVVVTNTGAAVSVTPEVPADTPPVTMTFDTVTGGGTTTVAVLDATTAPPPPSGFQVGSEPLYYEIETTAAFTGQVTICFSYAGVDFGGQTPRLFHYVNGAWVDITSSVDTATQTLCGTTTSFSPFAIFTSPTPFTTGTGFYAPVSPQAGFVNAAKAGSTVPLKFNVYVNGAEKVDTAGLQFAVTTVACTLAPEDPVDYATQENTSLRYDTTAHQFILNWKTPKATGCYIARVTNADGLKLSATFKLK